MGLTTSQISDKTLVPVCRQLATSYNAGIPILRSLALVEENTSDRRMKTVIREMSDAVRQGATLGDAAQMQGKYLPPFFIALVNGGEHGGRLDVMLKDLALYFEDRVAIKRSVSRAMTYPSIQLTICWFLGSFALRIINSLDFNSTTPFSLDDFFQAYINFQMKAMGVFAIIVVVCIILARMGIFRWIVAFFTTFLWPMRPVTRRFALARFFRSLSLLITSGLHIKTCVEQSAVMANNPYIEKDLLLAIPRIQSGMSLVESFAMSKTLTSTAKEMLYVGEESGNLDVTLRKVAEYHLDEANHAVNVAIKAFSTFIGLAVALVVGYIIISFYSKYFGMLNDIMS